MTDQLQQLRRAAIEALQSSAPGVRWRHHGVGMLQLYLTPSHRLHVWHESLLAPGITESGAIHDHRFDLHSTVLAGSIRNSALREAHDGSLHFDIWEIPRASKGTTSELRRVGEFRGYRGHHRVIHASGCHRVPRGDFHWARPDGQEVAVTSVLVMDKRDRPARLLCPPGVRPKHAFDFSVDRKVIEDVKMAAVQALLLKCSEVV